MIQYLLKKKTFCTLVLALVLAGAAAPRARAEAYSAIDTPTTGVLDYSTYDLSFRLFSEGGVLSQMHLGVFKIVNLGFGWEVNSIIGNKDVSAGPPALFVKIRPYEGSMVLPAVAFGYDGQGYHYEKEIDEFQQREKGVFVVLGRELFASGFDLNVGANMADFKHGTVCGFLNASYTIEDTVTLLAEVDDVRYLPESRLNAGIRFALNDALHIDLSGRDIGSAGGRTSERTVGIGYRGSF